MKLSPALAQLINSSHLLEKIHTVCMRKGAIYAARDPAAEPSMPGGSDLDALNANAWSAGAGAGVGKPTGPSAPLEVLPSRATANCCCGDS